MSVSVSQTVCLRHFPYFFSLSDSDSDSDSDSLRLRPYFDLVQDGEDLSGDEGNEFGRGNVFREEKTRLYERGTMTNEDQGPTALTYSLLDISSNDI